MARKKICGIYKIQNKINGKCYIGQSIDIFYRWSQEKRGHINEYVVRSFNKYGLDNFEFSILKECERNELDQWERYFIKEYGSDNESKGYNLDSGGSIGKKYSKRYKNKMRKVLLDVSPRKRKIVQYDIYTGEIINIFNSIKKASEVLGCDRGSISSVLNKHSYTCHGFGWEYWENKENREIYDVVPNNTYKPIDQIDLNTGEVIATYFSISEAMEKNNMGHSISPCLSGRTKNAYGYGWVYKGECYKYLNDKENDFHRKICKVNDKGDVVNIYDNVNEAIKEHPDTLAYVIIQCTRKERNHTGGFYWFFHNELFDKYGKLNKEVLEKFDYKKSGRRKVCQIDIKTNEVINTFDSVTEASIYMGSDSWGVSHSLCSETQLFKGYNWCYEDEKDKIKPFKRSRTHKRKVYWVNETGDILSEYNSAEQASRECGIEGLSATNIRNVALGKSNSAKGTFWRYEEVA